MNKAKFISAVKKVFDACQRLSETSGRTRKFTPDGRMVGDIGEVIAKFFYEVELHKEGRHDWDATTYDGRNIQIKTTGGTSTYLKRPPKGGFTDELLMVFKINRKSDGYDLVYNGDIHRVWNKLEDKKENNAHEKTISLDSLAELQKSVHRKNIIPRR